MKAVSGYSERVSTIHLLRGGQPIEEGAQTLGRSINWAYKWRWRFFAHNDWNDLESQSRAPKSCPKRISAEIRAVVKVTRSELEQEASLPGHLSYIGGYAIRNRMRQQGVTPLPSRASIERFLSEERMTHPHQASQPKVYYPQLHPNQPHQLTQIDIVPRYLPGNGGCVSCFNGIDVFSHHPTGRQSLSKTSEDAASFMLQVVKELGIAKYTQIDNGSCFSGGVTHPGVIGKVVRVLLYLGSQPVFSPYYHPESNHTVERFHQDCMKNTWDKVEMKDLAAVQKYSAFFFELYCESGHQAELQGLSPKEVHWAQPVIRLPKDFQLPAGKLPITEGQVHFIRKVEPDHTINVTNIHWKVPDVAVGRGVRATLVITCHGSTLKIYDEAPEVSNRICLISYPFQIKEPVQVLGREFQRVIPVSHSWIDLAASLFRLLILKSPETGFTRCSEGRQLATMPLGFGVRFPVK
jgi:hypothetical protein